MRKFFNFSYCMLLVLFVTSCASTNSVNNGGLIQKRKHTKGFYWGGNNKESEEVAIVKSKRKSAPVVEPTTKDLTSSDVSKNTEEANEPYELKSFISSNDLIATNTTIQKEEFTRASTKKMPNKKSTSHHVSSVVGNAKGIIAAENKSKAKFHTEHQNKGGDAELTFILCIVLAILIPPLGVLVWTNIDWIKVLIAFLLMLLFWLPGIIYAVLVVLDKI